MGFGFNLGMVFIALPLTGLLLLLWLLTRKEAFGRLLLLMWTGIIALVFLISTMSLFLGKKEISKNDVYGEYVIDRSHFPGKQADWQYNHFRFKITERDSIYFYETDGKRIVRTHRGTVSFLEQYSRPRLVIRMDQPGHHVIQYDPTLYRTTWSFYYVFRSPRFYNVFFEKEKWEPLEN